jgi:PadR family transcriptional regulator, regulatory protein PadR
MYGLEIKKEIEGSTGGRMALGVSTMYQLLRRLEKKGLVESHWERTTKGPPRAYYEITPAGREVMRRYVAEVFAPDSPISAALNELMPRILRGLAESPG